MTPDALAAAAVRLAVYAAVAVAGGFLLRNAGAPPGATSATLFAGILVFAATLALRRRLVARPP